MAHTLLLADDSLTIQRVIELTFAEEDVEVVSVSDGDQAIERIELSPPDIVLADIGMPGRNGYQVAQYVKQSPKLSHIPVVLLTGAFEPLDDARASEAGIDGVLAKPFEPQLVIGRVKELLAKSRQAQDLSAPAARPPELSELDNYFDQLNAAFSKPSDAAPPAAAPTPAPVDEIDWFRAAAMDAGLEATPSVAEPSAAAAEPPAIDVPEPLAQTMVPTEPIAQSEPIALSEPHAGMTPTVPLAPSDEPASAVEAQLRDVRSSEPPPAAPQIPEMPVAGPSSAAPDATPMAEVPSQPQVQPQLHSETPRPAQAPAVHAVSSLADAFAALLAAEKAEGGSSAGPHWPSLDRPPALSTEQIVEQVTRRVLEQMSDRVVRETVTELVATVAERLIREEIDRIKASLR